MTIRLFLWYWLPVVLYASLIATLSSTSSPQHFFPGLFGEINDKIVHAVEYAILGVLCYRAFLFASGKGMAPYAGLLAILGATLFGLTDELHQLFVPLREADVWDWVADAIGAIVGVTVWQEVRPRFRFV